MATSSFAHNARMTMNMTMLRTVVASMAGLAVAAATVIGSGGPAGAAAAFSCQRSVAIDPQVTVSEAGRSLTFVVHTGGCAAPGEVSFEVMDGTAHRQADFLLGNSTLYWVAGDMSPRRITATIFDDALSEATLETFSVTLTSPSTDVRMAARFGLARIFDNDTRDRLATLDSRVCLVYKDGCAAGFPSPLGVWTFEPGLIISVPIIVNAAGPASQSASFDTSDGTLIAGLDYEPVHQTVNIPPGATVVYVPVKLLPHALTQNGAHLNVHVSNYPGGGVISNNGQVTVLL